MSQITLVRHGQANSGAQDEAGYDALSDLGARQSAWLGDYWDADRRAVRPGLHRHAQPPPRDRRRR